MSAKLKTPAILASALCLVLAATRTAIPADDGTPGREITNSGCAQTDNPTPGDRFTRGLLWKIEHDGYPPSFLLGTIHTGDPRILDLPAPVQAAFDEAESFAMETFFNGAGLLAMAEAMFFNDGRSLEGTVGKETYALVEQALRERELPTRDLNRKKPRAVIMTLGAPRAQGLLFLDLMLQKNAILAGKPNYKLETMDEQIAVMDQMPLKDQATLLKESVELEEQVESQMEAMIQAYLARDLNCLARIMRQGDPANSAAYSTMLSRLLTDRNRRMVERLQGLLQEGKIFIAVGAGHLPGDQGLLNLLERKGYRLTAVY